MPIGTGFESTMQALECLTIAVYWGNNRISNENVMPDFATGLITAMEDNGDGTILITSADNTLNDGTNVIISGTVSYNGVYTIDVVDEDSFNITEVWAGDESGGGAQWAISSGFDLKTYWLEHFPVNTDNLRLIGYIGADWAFLGNFDLEPLTGRITIPDNYPAFDEIHAWYNYYINVEFDILTKDFMVPLPRSTPELDVNKKPIYTKGTRYPSTVDFKMVLVNEHMRNLLTESILHNYNFLLLDTGIPEQYGLRAYEGGMVSDEQGSIFKGYSYLMPTTLEIQQFGLVDREFDGLITSLAAAVSTVTHAADAGGGEVEFETSTAHSFVTGDSVTIAGTTNYNGTYTITVTDETHFKVTVGWVSDQSGTATLDDWTAVAVGVTTIDPDEWVTITECTDMQYDGTWQVRVNGFNVYIHRVFGGFTETGIWTRKQEIDWTAFHTTI